MDLENQVYIETYSKEKLLSSFYVSLCDWYEGDIEAIDDKEFIRNNKIDKVKILCDNEVYINKYNSEGCPYSFDTYNDKNVHIDAERIIYNNGCMIGNVKFDIGEEIKVNIKFYDKNAKSGDRYIVEMKYKSGSETLNNNTYYLYVNSDLKICFANRCEDNQRCIINISKDGTDELYTFDVEF